MGRAYPCDNCVVLVLVEEHEQVARQAPRGLGHQRRRQFVETDDGGQYDVRSELVGLGGQVDDLLEGGVEVYVDELFQPSLP